MAGYDESRCSVLGRVLHLCVMTCPLPLPPPRLCSEGCGIPLYVYLFVVLRDVLINFYLCTRSYLCDIYSLSPFPLPPSLRCDLSSPSPPPAFTLTPRPTKVQGESVQVGCKIGACEDVEGSAVTKRNNQGEPPMFPRSQGRTPNWGRGL